MSDHTEVSFADLLAGLEMPEPAPVIAAPVSKAVNSVAAIESTPHLLARVQMMWGTRDFNAFVGTLFVDTRDGARKGLPVEVAEELLFLSPLDKMRRALDLATRLNMSVKEAYQLIEREDQGPLKIPVGKSPAAKTPDIQFVAGQKGLHSADRSWRLKAAFIILFALAILTAGILFGLHSAGYNLRHLL